MKKLFVLVLLVLGMGCMENPEIKTQSNSRVPTVEDRAGGGVSPLATCGSVYRWWHSTMFPVMYTYGPGNMNQHFDITIRPMFLIGGGTNPYPGIWRTDIPQLVQIKWKYRNTSATGATVKMRTRLPGQGWSPKQTILAGNLSTLITCNSSNPGSCTVNYGDIAFEIEIERVTCGSPTPPSNETRMSGQVEIISITPNHEFGPALATTNIMLGVEGAESAGTCAALLP